MGSFHQVKLETTWRQEILLISHEWANAPTDRGCGSHLGSKRRPLRKDVEQNDIFKEGKHFLIWQSVAYQRPIITEDTNGLQDLVLRVFSRGKNLRKDGTERYKSERCHWFLGVILWGNTRNNVIHTANNHCVFYNCHIWRINAQEYDTIEAIPLRF